MPKDEFNKKWITENALEVLQEYADPITVRQLYYRLVARGMINDINHYKRVVNSMSDARWEGSVDFTAFIDRERTMFGETKADAKNLDSEIANGKGQVKAWMNAYHLNRWENQPNYVEVFIEKKALQGVFEGPCEEMDVGLGPCKGYPSLTFLNEASDRFNGAVANDKTPIILYFGDYDPSGEDIPRAVKDNLARMGCDVEVKRIALHPDQIRRYHLPSVPAKASDSRSRTWGGAGVVELDAVEPRTLTQMCKDAIDEVFDDDLYSELEQREEEERDQYRDALKEFVNNLED